MLSCVLLCMIVWGEIVSEGEGRISLLSKGVFASASTLVMVDLFFIFLNIVKLHKKKDTKDTQDKMQFELFSFYLGQ